MTWLEWKLQITTSVSDCVDLRLCGFFMLTLQTNLERSTTQAAKTATLDKAAVDINGKAVQAVVALTVKAASQRKETPWMMMKFNFF